MLSALRRAGSELLELLLPPACPLCGEVLPPDVTAAFDCTR